MLCLTVRLKNLTAGQCLKFVSDDKERLKKHVRNGEVKLEPVSKLDNTENLLLK